MRQYRIVAGAWQPQELASPGRANERRAGEDVNASRVPAGLAAHGARVGYLNAGDGAVQNGAVQSAADGFNLRQFGHAISIAHRPFDLSGHGGYPLLRPIVTIYSWLRIFMQAFQELN